MGWAHLGFGIVCTKDPKKGGLIQTWLRIKTSVDLCGQHDSSCAVEIFLSITILCSLKPSTPNNIVSFFSLTKFYVSKLLFYQGKYRGQHFVGCMPSSTESIQFGCIF